MGPFPMAMRQLKFLIVRIDYFIKWDEGGSLGPITKKNVQGFIWKSVICRFGKLRVFIFDNGKQFDNNAFKISINS